MIVVFPDHTHLLFFKNIVIYIIRTRYALPVCSVSRIYFTSIGLVCNCVKLFGFDCVICGISLPVSFKSDCCLKCMLRRFAFSISSMHIVLLIFKGGIDDLSWVDI